MTIIAAVAWDLGMSCSLVCIEDNKIPFKCSYFHVTWYRTIVKNIRRSWFFVILRNWGYHYCLATVLVEGFYFVPFSSHLLFSFVLSVNALLTLLMPYVSGLVLLKRSLPHTYTHRTAIANAIVRLLNSFTKALIHTLAPFFCFLQTFEQ